jgi:hypothetical protein
MGDRMRGICHESGHTVLGLHFGFDVEKIQLTDGRPNVACDLDSPERNPNHRFLFLAGGIAGETLAFPNTHYDVEASGRDQAMITELGGGHIEEYLDEALKIISSYKKVFSALQIKMIPKWLEGEMEIALTSTLSGSPRHSFQLLSREEIEQVWATHRKA